VPLHYIELDLDALKRQWATREEVTCGGSASEPDRPVAACGHQH